MTAGHLASIRSEDPRVRSHRARARWFVPFFLSLVPSFFFVFPNSSNSSLYLSHTEPGLQRALTATSVIYQTDLNLLTTDAVLSAFTNDPRLVRVPRSSLPLDLAHLAAEHKVAASRSELSLYSSFFLLLPPRRRVPLSLTLSSLFLSLSLSPTPLGKARQILDQGGCQLNGSKVSRDSDRTLKETDLLDGRFAVIKVGKTGDLVVVVDEEHLSLVE